MSSFSAYDTAFGGNFILLSAGSGVTVGPVQTYEAQNLTGYIYTTKSGVASLQQAFDGVNYDVTFPIVVTSGVYSFNQPVLGPYAQLVFTNGSNAQTGLFKAYLKAQTTGVV